MDLRRLGLALVALAAIWVFWSWWSSDRRQIERQTDRLQKLVSKSGPENAIQGMASANAIAGLFATEFEVRALQLNFSTRNRQELVRFIFQHRSASDSIRMRVRDSSLSIAPEHARATQNATFDFPSGGPLGSADERYRVQVNWVEEEGEWRMDYIDLVEILPTPPRRAP